MSQYQGTDLEALGPGQLICRPMSRKYEMKALGRSVVALYISAFITAFFLTMPLTFLAMYWDVPAPVVAHPVWGPIHGIWYVVCVVVFIKLSLGTPKTGSLAIHQHGFRYYKRLVRYSDINEIVVGQLHPKLLRVMAGPNPIAGASSVTYGNVHVVLHNSMSYSVVVILKDGTAFEMLNLVIRYERDDVASFFQSLVANNVKIPAQRVLDSNLSS